MSANKLSIEDKIKNLEKQISWFDSEDFSINQAIEKYELGLSDPNLPRLIWLAEALNTTVAVLIGEI